MTASAHPDWARESATWPNATGSRFVRADAISWHVQVMGSGPDLLLLHGAGAATHSWRDLMPLLAQTHRVIAPDLPGHGFTRAPHGPVMGLPGMAQAIAGLCTALDVTPAATIGHSAGAAVGIHMTLDGAPTGPIIGLNAALTPFRGLAGVLFPPMAKMLALNPFTPWVFSRFAGSRGQAGRLLASTGSDIGRDGTALYARMIARPAHVAGALEMMARWELEPMLARLVDLTVPVTLVIGEGDRSVPPAEAKRLARDHAGIRLINAGDRGHLMHEETPAEIAALITEILDGKATGP